MARGILWAIITGAVYGLMVKFGLDYAGEVPAPGWWEALDRRYPSLGLDFPAFVHFGALVVSAATVAVILTSIVASWATPTALLASGMATYGVFREALDPLGPWLTRAWAEKGWPGPIPDSVTGSLPESALVLGLLPLFAWIIVVLNRLVSDLVSEQHPVKIPETKNTHWPAAAKGGAAVATGGPASTDGEGAEAKRGRSGKPAASARRERRKRKRPPALEGRLLKLCMGDEQKLERLIAHERKQRKGMTRTEAITRAIDAIQRDGR